MSDYFGALMRSIGMPAQGQVLASALRDPTRVRETDSNSPEPGLRAAPQAVPATQIPAPPSALVSRLPAAPHQLLQGSNPRDAAAEFVVQAAQVEPSGAAEGWVTDALSPAALPPKAHVPAPNPDIGHTLVRAALQWVASGPQAPESLAVTPAPLAFPAAPPATDIPAAQVASASTFATSMVASARASSTATAAAVSPPPGREDRIEVTIGAIHLRVDSPAVQTVVRAPAPPAAPAAASAAPAPAPRSALSRRALRRI